MFMQMAARRRRMGGFSPLTLFAASEPGVWLDPSDLTTLFQNDAGTTPVTAAGQSVGMVLDKSQQPGPELHEGDISVSPWVTIGTLSSLSASSFTNSSGAGAGVALVVGVGKTVKVEVSFSKNTAASFSIRRAGASADTIEYAASTGLTGSFSVVVRMIGDLDKVYFRLAGNGQITFSRISVRELPGNHATQSIFAARPIYRVSSGIPHIEDDLIDDSLNWTAPAGSYTVAWCDTAGNVTIQTAQALSGATDALRTQRMVGYLAINRALTAAETANLTAWFQRKAGV